MQFYYQVSRSKFPSRFFLSFFLSKILASKNKEKKKSTNDPYSFLDKRKKNSTRNLEDDGVNSTRSAQELNILDNELHVPVTRARRGGVSIDSTSFLSLGGHHRSFPTCLRGSWPLPFPFFREDQRESRLLSSSHRFRFFLIEFWESLDDVRIFINPSIWYFFIFSYFDTESRV